MSATVPDAFVPMKQNSPPGREEVLDIAARTGDLLLRNGAETYRVEETISRICAAYGYISEPFALPTGVFVSISGADATPGGTIASGAGNAAPLSGTAGPQAGLPPSFACAASTLSVVRRVKARTIDLGKVARLNAFARDVALHHPGHVEALQALQEINATRPYSPPVIFLSYALTAAVFTLLYHGSPLEAAGALIIGTMLAGLRVLFMQRALFPFLEYFTGGLVAGFFSLLGTRLFADLNAYVVITGALINLMPGTALVNGIRDMLNGDSVSGIARLGEAILSVSIMAAGAAIAVGAAMALPIWR